MDKKRVLIAFIPPKDIINNLKRIRKMAFVQMSLGLKTNHITITDNTYCSIKEIDRILNEFSKKQSVIDAEIIGLGSFVVKDKEGIERYKKSNSLIYRIKDNNELSRIRKIILQKIRNFKTLDRYNTLLKENKNLSDKRRLNLKRFGTPFGLKEWKFHVTVGSIPKDKQKLLFERFNRLKFEKSFKVDKFALYIRKPSGWNLYKVYNLEGGTQKRKIT